MPENRAAAFDETLSPVHLEGKIYGIAAISIDSCSNTALFLCNPDCVAERLRFEPSVPFQQELPYIEVPTGRRPVSSKTHTPTALVVGFVIQRSAARTPFAHDSLKRRENTRGTADPQLVDGSVPSPVLPDEFCTRSWHTMRVH